MSFLLNVKKRWCFKQTIFWLIKLNCDIVTPINIQNNLWWKNLSILEFLKSKRQFVFCRWEIKEFYVSLIFIALFVFMDMWCLFFLFWISFCFPQYKLYHIYYRGLYQHLNHKSYTYHSYFLTCVIYGRCAWGGFNSKIFEFVDNYLSQ